MVLKIELRLNDEKRQLLKVGDLIEFTNRSNEEKLIVEVLDLLKYATFEELYQDNDKISMGYGREEVASYSDMKEYYSKEEQEKYGVLGIKIKVLKR